MDLFQRSSYAFDLPESLIAAYPLDARADARLLVVRKATRTIESSFVRNLPVLLPARSVLVANNTKVIRARLKGARVGSPGKIEFFLLKKLDTALWQGLIRSSAKIAPGFLFWVGEEANPIQAEVLARDDTNAGTIFTVKLSSDPIDEGIGEVPLPPYIVAKREVQNLDSCQVDLAVRNAESGFRQVNLAVESENSESRPLNAAVESEKLGFRQVNLATKSTNLEIPQHKPTMEQGNAELRQVNLAKSLSAENKFDELAIYNTVYAKHEGSVAAPTAGRHFTPELIEELRAHGFSWEEITLHVGLGTFKPVMADDVREHTMHGESSFISEATADHLVRAKLEGRPIIAVGTTSTRTLEGRAVRSSDSLGVFIAPGEKEINLFIHPGSGHDWKLIDGMLTNFHLPESTLLMMVASFVGDLEFVKEIYQTAIREKYRFYSYGDAMLILP